MTEKQKYYTIGGIMLALIGFLGYKAFAKPKTPVPPKPPKRRGTVIVDEPSTGGFLLPAEVTTRSGTRLRSSSSTNSSVVYTYTAGTKLLVKGDATESDGQWFQVFDSPAMEKSAKFDWQILKNLKITKPYLVAGSININNVDEVLKYKPYGIDISGGVEKSRGIKSNKKIIEFLDKVKA